LREPSVTALRFNVEAGVRPPNLDVAAVAAIDSKPLEITLHSKNSYADTRTCGIQLFAPHNKSACGKGLGNRLNNPGRLRCVEMLEGANNEFCRSLLAARTAIKRFFTPLTNFDGSLTCLLP